jgi:ribosomal protein L3 glutamine methyltransferase
VVDIGSGSGIIGTSVADLADEVIFLDISEQALHIAEKNFRSHFPDKKAQFIVSDLLSALPTSYLLPPTSSILFLTNLPYIRDEDWQNMSDDTVYEPKLALFG